jgi:hypothetical protein
MPLPTWPGGVPAAPRDGWQMPEMFRAPVATEMEGGNQRLRSQPGSNVATISYPLQPLDGTQWAAFETFVRTTLNNGTSRFTMSLLIGTSLVSKTVQLEQGKSPSVSRQGGFMHITLSLRVYGM